MTGGTEPCWATAAQHIAIDGLPLAAEELSDVCSLLLLADRVHVFSLGAAYEAAELLGGQLRGLGWSSAIHRDAPSATATVAETDTVVVFSASRSLDDLDLTRLESVTGTRAVLIAIAPADAVDVVRLADAVVTVPIPARMESRAMRHIVFDLLACLVVDVIGRDLCRRLNHKAMSRSIWRMEPHRRTGRKPDLAPVEASVSPLARVANRCPSPDRWLQAAE